MAKRWLGLDWQLSLSSGWGIAGLYMAWVIEQDGCFKPVPLYPSAQLQSVRAELKDFAAKLYRHEEEVSGAEIGVQEGIYSEHILKTWKGSTLCCSRWLECSCDGVRGVSLLVRLQAVIPATAWPCHFARCR